MPPVDPITPAELQQYSLNALHESWFHRDAVAFDDMVNVFAGGNPDETISSRMARWATEDSGFKKSFGSAVVDALDRVQKNHGAKAIVSDEVRAAQVSAIEKSTPTIEGAK